MDFIFRMAEKFLKKHKRLMQWRRFFAVLAAVVVFATTYELILPAITMDRKKAAETSGIEIGIADETMGEEGLFQEQPTNQDAQYAEGLGAEYLDSAGLTTGEAALEEQASALRSENALNTGADSAGTLQGTETGSMSTGTETAIRETAESGNAETEDPASTFFDVKTGNSETGNSDSDSDSESGGLETALGAEGPSDASAADRTEETGLAPGDVTGEAISTEAGTKEGSNQKEDPAMNAEPGTGIDSGTDADSEIEADPEAATDPAADAGSEAETDSGTNTDSVTNADSASAENGDPAQAENEAETDPAALDPDSADRMQPGILTFENPEGGYTITAAFDETAALPAGTQLSAVEILPGTVYKDENEIPVYAGYEEYYDKTLRALDEANNLGDRMLASARFFDITFLDAGGNPVEPAGPVSISVKYKDPLQAGNATDTIALHFDDIAIQDRQEQEKPEIGEAVLIETEETVTASEEKTEIEQVSFTNDKFSVYGVVYTVDFEYEKDEQTFRYSMEGGSSIRLSEIFEALQVEYALHGVPALPGSSEAVEDSASVEDSETAENSASIEGGVSDDDSVSAGHAEGGVASETLTLTGRSLLDAVTSLTFSNPDLIRVTREEADGDWILESLEPFDTQETLTVSIKDGGKILIGVSDANVTPVELTVGEIRTITGTVSSDSHYWYVSAGDASAVILTGSGNTATITGEKAGSATITHEYGKKGQGQNSNKKETYAVTVKAAEESETLTEEDCTAQSAEDSGFTVSVKETGNLKKLSDYHVVAAGADTDYSDDADVLKVYHIYLADENEEEVPAEKLKNNGKDINLQVTLTYDTVPDWFVEAKDVKHYKNGKEQSINNVKIDQSNHTVSFIVHGFSDFTITSGSTSSTGGGTEVTSQKGSILDGQTFDDANEWQIVNKEYENNDAENKMPSSDGNVRVQKSVIPTEKENYFDVYLSIDYKQAFADYFATAAYEATTANDLHDKDLGTVTTSMEGNEKVAVTGNSGVYSNWQYFTFITEDGEILAKDVKLYWSQASNVTFYLKVDSGGSTYYILTGTSIKPNGTGNAKPEIILLTRRAEQLIMSSIASRAILNSVTDQMGDYVEFINVIDGDYESKPTCEDGVLSWIPVTKPNPAISKEKTNETVTVSYTDHSGNVRTITTYKYISWAMNIAELLYRAKLDVNQDGFQSCAETLDDKSRSPSYQVNTQATLTYDNNKTVNFPVPYVRGLLYDLAGKKEDENGRLLGGAVFSLTGTDVYDSAVSKSITSMNTAYGTSGSNLYYYAGLAAAKDENSYVLQETKAPPGYKLGEEVKNVYLNYTENRANLVQSVIDPTHMMLADSPTVHTFTDTPDKITVTKIWADEKDHSGEQVNVTLHASNGAEIESGATQVLNSANNWTHTWNKLPQYEYDPDGKIRNITYSVTENSVPGYSCSVTSSGEEEFYKLTGDLGFTVKNTPVQYEVVLTKVDPEGNPLQGAEITLSGGTKPISWQSESAGGKTFGSSEIEVGKVYTISETVAPDGYLKGEGISFMLAEDGEGGYVITDENGNNWTNNMLNWESSAAEGKTTISLKLINRPYKVVVTKVGQDDRPLTGAQITIQDKAKGNAIEGGNNISVGTVTYQNGEIAIDREYVLTENKAPDGFNDLGGPITFKIKPDAGHEGGYDLETTNEKLALTVTPYTNENKVATFDLHLTNDEGAELPHTGGTGFISPQTFIGIMAMAFVLAAGIMYSFSERREERRSM